MTASRAPIRMRGLERDVAGGIRSVLVIQTKYIGDVTLASALSAGLRRAFPGIRIGMICERNLAEFALDNAIADETIPLDRARGRRSPLYRLREQVGIVARARRGRFDMSIDLTDGTTSQVQQILIGARVRVGYDPPGKRLPLAGSLARTVAAAPFGSGRHYVDRYLAPLQALGIDTAGLTPRLVPSAARQEEADALLAAHGLRPGGFIAVHAGARTEPRRWPPERFAGVLSDVAARTGLDIVLVGGPDERDLSERVASQCAAPAVNLAGRCALAAMPALLSRARLFAGNESGPMHIAAAVGTPVVGLFGLTDPGIWGPVSDRAIALRPAMPCHCIAPGLCHGIDASKSWCVGRIGEADVAAAIERLLAQTAVG